MRAATRTPVPVDIASILNRLLPSAAPADITEREVSVMSRRVVVLGWVIAAVLGLPRLAAAQSIGVGPRFAFVRGDLGLETPATTFVGATVRYRVTRHISFELAG